MSQEVLFSCINRGLMELDFIVKYKGECTALRVVHTLYYLYIFARFIIVV